VQVPGRCLLWNIGDSLKLEIEMSAAGHARDSSGEIEQVCKRDADT
jgi:hypothetical protein